MNMIPSPSLSTQRVTRQTRKNTQQIAPIIGIITSEDLPQRGTANLNNMKKDAQVGQATDNSDHARIRTLSCKKLDISQAALIEEQCDKSPSTVFNQTPMSSEVKDEQRTRIRAVRSSCWNSVTETQQTRSGRKAAGKQMVPIEKLEKSSKMAAKAQERQISPAVITSGLERQPKVVIRRMVVSEGSVLINSENKQATESLSKHAAVSNVMRKRKFSISTPEKNQLDTIDE